MITRRLKLWLKQQSQSSKKLIREYNAHCLLKDEDRAVPEVDANDQIEPFETATDETDEIKTFENVTRKRRGKRRKKRKKKDVSHRQDLIQNDVGVISDRKEESHDSDEQLIASPVYSDSSFVATTSSCPTMDYVTLMSARLKELTQEEIQDVESKLSSFKDEELYYESKRLAREKNPHKNKFEKYIVKDSEGDAKIVENFDVTITKGTICLLRPGFWLNDEVKITI
jgi:hypothetical protein